MERSGLDLGRSVILIDVNLIEFLKQITIIIILSLLNRFLSFTSNGRLKLCFQKVKFCICSNNWCVTFHLIFILYL